MKRIGIIGGMDYELTIDYYEGINHQVNKRIGGAASADLILRNVNFEEYRELIRKSDWQEISRRLRIEARRLVLDSACDYVVIAADELHKVADYVSEPYHWAKSENSRLTHLKIPLIHLSDGIAKQCKEVDAKRILLLGTAFTMTEAFLSKKLRERGVRVMPIIDCLDEVTEIDRIISEELRHGIVTSKSKKFILNFIHEFPLGKKLRP